MKHYKQVILPITTTIVVGIILLVTTACANTSELPKTGDRYLFKLDDGQFSIIKITQSDQKKIYYLQNDYSVSSPQFIDSIDIDLYYSDDPKSINISAFNTAPYIYYKSKPNKK